jgi:hypothetical protein
MTSNNSIILLVWTHAVYRIVCTDNATLVIKWNGTLKMATIRIKIIKADIHSDSDSNSDCVLLLPMQAALNHPCTRITGDIE